METFRIWLRPLGDSCRVRIDGIANARWLLDRLKGTVAFQPFVPDVEASELERCTFRVPCNSRAAASRLQTLLTALPEVRLMTEPA